MDRVAQYLRCSGQGHDVSVESQKRELDEFARAKGYAVTAVFEDKVESAKSDNRPAFQELVAEAKRPNRRFDIVLCLDTSRFARNTFHAKSYKRLLRKQYGVRVEFAKLSTSDDCHDVLVEGFMENVDQFHSDKSRADGLRGMRQNVLNGHRAGGRAPIGYKLNKTIKGTQKEGMPITKSNLIRDPENFNTVQKYLECRANGVNRMAAASSTGLKLSCGTLIGIEDNALQYAGHTVWNRHNEKIDGCYVGKKKLRPKDQWVITRDTHEAMISDEQAKSISLQRAENGRKQHRGRRSPYLLAGILKCPCGANFNGDGGYYRCHRSD